VVSVAVIYRDKSSGDLQVNITVLERFCEVTGVLNIYFMNLEILKRQLVDFVSHL